jgi:hypothetical protein
VPGLWTPPGLHYPRGFSAPPKATVTITASGTANTKGTWTQVIASTADDYYGFWTYADGMGVTATVTGGLLDIGYGVAGGSDPGSDVNLVPDWDVGWTGDAAANNPLLATMQYWPIFVPSGSKIWARLAAAVVSDTCRVMIVGQTAPSFPGMHANRRAEAVGEVSASSRGTVATSGAAVYGTPVSLGTTGRDNRLWTVGVDGGTDSSLSNLGFFLVKLSIASDGTSPIGEWVCNVNTTTEMVGGPFPPVPVYKPVPSGTTIYAAINATATGDSLGVIAYGM